jgi:malate dehydrogenase (quinone)
MRWSEEQSELTEWMPLVMAGRDLKQPVAATRIDRGTDVDFGTLTRAYLMPLQQSGALTVVYGTQVQDLKRLRHSDMTEADWRVVLKGPSGKKEVRAPFVFLGAGGGALPLLQRSGIPEAADFAGFPVSGLWLVCGDAQLADRQRAKVYGKAAVGAPPMSVPHLDTRWQAVAAVRPLCRFQQQVPEARFLAGSARLRSRHQSAADAAGGSHQFRTGAVPDQSAAPEPCGAA